MYPQEGGKDSPWIGDGWGIGVPCHTAPATLLCVLAVLTSMALEPNVWFCIVCLQLSVRISAWLPSESLESLLEPLCGLDWMTCVRSYLMPVFLPSALIGVELVGCGLLPCDLRVSWMVLGKNEGSFLVPPALNLLDFKTCPQDHPA